MGDARRNVTFVIRDSAMLSAAAKQWRRSYLCISSRELFSITRVSRVSRGGMQRVAFVRRLT